MPGGEAMERMVRVETLGERLGALRLCEAGALARMQQSLASVGQVSAIAVFAAAEGGLEVLDGFKRLRAAKALGWSELRAHALAVDAAGAKVALAILHDRDGLTELEEAWLVRSLYREDRLSQPEIGRRLSRDKSWVCRRLLVAEGLDDAVQADVRLGLLTPSAAAALARLPRRNQRPAAQVVARTGMTFRQTARFVEELLGCADEPTRTVVLERWRVAPPPRAAPHPARRARSEAEWTMADVATLTRVAARLEARLLGQPLSAFGARAGELCARALTTLVPVLAALGRTIAHVTGEAPAHALDHPRGPAAPDGHPPSPGPLPPGHRPGARGEPQHHP
jgi:ParB-like chromosome segregation protein Spo0J